MLSCLRYLLCVHYLIYQRTSFDLQVTKVELCYYLALVISKLLSNRSNSKEGRAKVNLGITPAELSFDVINVASNKSS